MDRYYYQGAVYTKTQLQRKFGSFALLETYPVIKGSDPEYNDMYVYPSIDNTYTYDADKECYIEEVSYLPRSLVDVQFLVTQEVKRLAQEATKSCCDGIDSVLLNHSAPEQFTDIKTHLALVATELHNKLEGITAAATVDEIKVIVDTPFSSH